MAQSCCAALCGAVGPQGWHLRSPTLRRLPSLRGRQRLVCAALDSRKTDSQTDSAGAAGEPGTPGALECFGVGQEVECRLVDDGLNPAPLPEPAPTSLLGLLLLVSPFFFWGTSMVAMKELAPHTTPLLVASWRLIPAGAVLLLWAKQSGRERPKQPMAWVAVALFGLVDAACFQGFLAEGLQRTSAGLGSVIIDSQPLSVALLASLLFGEKLGAAGVAGLFVGVFGLCLLQLPPAMLTSLPESLSAVALQLASSSSGGGELADAAAAAAAAAAATSSSGAAADLATAAAAAGSGSGIPEAAASSSGAGGAAGLAAAAAASLASAAPSGGGGGGDAAWSIWDSGEWWMLLAAQSMAVGTVMVRWVAKYCDPVVATGWHMVLGGLPLLAYALVQEGPEAQERLALLTGSDALLLLYISLLGSAASYGVFFYNASRGNLTALSSLTFLTPMFAAVGGYLALGETLTPLQLTGAAVTLGAVSLINTNSSDKEESS